MKIVITGCNGQLGSELRSIIENCKSEIDNLPKLSDTKAYYTDIDVLDLSDYEKTFDYINSIKPDAVINCAAFTNVDLCESDVDSALKANALIPRNLALICEKLELKLIQISTDYVFSGDGEKPYREWDLCDPQSIYGNSKLLGEQYVQQFCSKYFIIRTSWLYGYTGNNFVKTIIKLAQEKGELNVVNDQRGNPTNANDLAHHILKLIFTDEFGIYHCTGNGECTWYEFACKIVEIAGIKCNINPCTTAEFLRPAKRPSYSSLDNLMLRNTIGDEMRDWKTALKSFVDIAKKRNLI